MTHVKYEWRHPAKNRWITSEDPLGLTEAPAPSLNGWTLKAFSAIDRGYFLVEEHGTWELYLKVSLPTEEYEEVKGEQYPRMQSVCIHLRSSAPVPVDDIGPDIVVLYADGASLSFGGW